MLPKRTIKMGLCSRVTLEEGKPYEPYAWPGGYPIVYYTGNNDSLCAGCATKQEEANQESEWPLLPYEIVTGCDVLEGSAVDHGIVLCEECGESIVALDSDSEWGCSCGQINDNNDGRCSNCHVQKGC